MGKRGPEKGAVRPGSRTWHLLQLDIGDHMWVELGNTKESVKNMKNTFSPAATRNPVLMEREFKQELYTSTSRHTDIITYLAKIIRVS